MTRLLCMIALLSMVLLAGCRRPEPTVVQVENKPPEVKVEIQQKPVEPAPPKPSPPSFIPSANYRKGYDDGYYGTWLGPVRWLATADYRNGWSAGESDRVNGLPHRFTK